MEKYLTRLQELQRTTEVHAFWLHKYEDDVTVTIFPHKGDDPIDFALFGFDSDEQKERVMRQIEQSLN